MDTLHQFRKEVLDFSRAAEALISPATLDAGELTGDERDMVVMYAKNVLEQYTGKAAPQTLPLEVDGDRRNRLS